MKKMYLIVCALSLSLTMAPALSFGQDATQTTPSTQTDNPVSKTKKKGHKGKHHKKHAKKTTEENSAATPAPTTPEAK
jgi:hypothetical protein